MIFKLNFAWIKFSETSIIIYIYDNTCITCIISYVMTMSSSVNCFKSQGQIYNTYIYKLYFLHNINLLVFCLRKCYFFFKLASSKAEVCLYSSSTWVIFNNNILVLTVEKNCSCRWNTIVQDLYRITDIIYLEMY